MSLNDPGYLLNLSPEQRCILQRYWTILLPTISFDSTLTGIIEKSEQEKKDKEENSKKGWLWNSKSNSTENVVAEELPKAVPSVLDNWTDAEEVLFLFNAYDHPDTISLRFIRAEKWDEVKGVEKIHRTLVWRKQFDVKELLLKGESLINDSELKTGKGYIHGVDNEGRPICYIHVRFHDKSARVVADVEKFMILIMETCRNAMTNGCQQATLIFDMGDFGLKNMDYDFINFMLKVFQDCYPESLGRVLILNAPWVFNGCWAIIKNWVDPVVEKKILFISKDELLKFVNENDLPKLLKPENDFEFKFIEATEQEITEFQTRLNNKEAALAAWENYKKMVKEFLAITKVWASAEEAHYSKHDQEREETIIRLKAAYILLVPYIKAKTHYHRANVVDEPGFQ